MALQTMQKSSDSGLNGILNLLTTGSNLFSGSNSKTTGTTNTSISQDAMNSMLVSLLEGTGGLADTLSGQKGAGLYNSSVNTLLGNDLVTRAAARVAEQNKTTTTAQQTRVPAKSSLGDLAGIIGGASLLSNLFSGDSSSSKSKGVLDYADDFLGGGSGAASDGHGFFGGLGDYFGWGSSGEAAAGGGASIWSTAMDYAGPVLGTGFAAYNSYEDIKDDNWGGAVGSAAGYYFGGPIGAFAGQAIGTWADNALGGTVQDIWKGAGDVVTDAVGGIGDAVSDVFGGGCFITTAVCEKYGFADDCEMLQKLRKYRDEFMLTNPDYAHFVKQYYEEAPVMVEAVKLLPPYQQDLVWTKCYEEFLVKAVEEIDAGNNESAFNIYREMFEYMYQLVYSNLGWEHK